MRFHQRWDDVLFLHWRVAVNTLRPYLPSPLEVAAYKGDAWVSAVLFRLSVRPRWLPFLPGVSRLVELNLRTYVHCHGRPAIWFLNVQADNRVAIRLARLLVPIPYVYRPLRYRAVGDQFQFSRRGVPGPAPVLRFRPTGTATPPLEGSLDEWLLDRYRLVAPGRFGRLREAEVAHRRWCVQGVEMAIEAGGFGREIGLDLPRVPDLAHFSPGVRAQFGEFSPVEAVGPKQGPHVTGAPKRAAAAGVRRSR